MNKIKKLLSVLAVTATLGAGIAGIAGCEGCDGNDNGDGHTHNYSWTDNGNGTHTGKCDADGCEKPEIKNEAHEWGDDNVCDKCDAVKQEYWTVTVDLNDGSTPTTKSVVKGEKLTIDTPLRAGYKFTGWKVDGADWSVDTAITGDITIVAQWVEATYSVSYDMHGHGTAPEGVTEVKTLPETLPTVANEEGWRFDGWYMDAEFKTPAVAGTALAEDATLHAKWAQLFTVSFDLRGRVGSYENLTDISNLPAILPSPTAKGLRFDGWYLDKGFETPAVTGAELTANTTLYAKWTILDGYEEVKYTMSVSDMDTGKSASDIIVNKYTLGANTEVRTRTKTWTDPETNELIEFTKSVKMGGSSDKITIDAPSEGKLYIWIQNGSSSADYQTINLKKPDGSTQAIEYIGNIASSPVVRLELDVVAGKYEITRPSGTSDIYKMEMTCVVEEAEESGFEIVSEGTVDFITGQQYDASKIQLNKVYGNGRTETLDITDANVVVDSKAFDGTAAGEYTISVKYKDYEAQTFTVKVYELQSIRLGFNATEKISNSAAGNGVYFNQTVKRVYKVGEDFTGNYLSVTAIATLEGASKEFLLANADFESDASTSFDKTKAGKYTITVTVKGTTVKETFDVFVVDTEPSVVNEVVQVKVDGTYKGEIGAVNDDYNCFVTIQQALDYLGNLGKDFDAKKKLIVLAEGVYNEKLEVTLPNIELRGAGADKTIIEWNSLYGVADESGYIQTTDSCSTFSVREKATNMLITGVTLSNYWNSLEVFDKDLGAGYQEHRALALLVQADQFKMKDCKLLGYQDTVEFFTGRQFIENTYISGTTDFIFGTNNTTYFKNCQIHSITNGKTDGGYITAFKGCNKGDGSGDWVQYGAIFDGCHFTADDDVVKNKNTAIGRCWGAYAAVMVMNSELDGHISTTPFNNSNKNQRYVSMNAKPTDETVKFFEYNNTGAGAISASIAGVTVLTDATGAAKYADFEVIFGTANGKVSYANAWDPTSNTPVEDTNIYYNFAPALESATGTNYTVETTLDLKASGTVTAEFGDMTLDATNGNIGFNASSGYTNLKAGAKVTFSVEANSTVVVTTYPNYHAYTINGVATVNDTFSKFFAAATEVEIVSTGDLYLGQIIIRSNQKAPAAATLEKVELKDAKTEFTVGDDFEVGNLKVLATYSDGALVELTDEEYEVTQSIDKTAAGTYTVTVTVGTITKTYEVTYEAADADQTITKTTFLDFTADGGYENSRVNYTEATVTRNGDNTKVEGTIKFDVKAGAKIIVIPHPNYGHFTIGKVGETDLEECTETETYTATTDCTIAITGTSNNYFKEIKIVYPVSENITYTFRTDGDAEHKITTAFQNNAGYADIFYVDATTGKLAPRGQQWAQFNDTTKIKFTVAAGATVTINGYDDNSYSVNGTASATKNTTITCENETEIEIIATADTYIDSISISFPEAE